jgi:hypothetical protein
MVILITGVNPATRDIKTKVMGEKIISEDLEMDFCCFLQNSVFNIILNR